MKTIKVYTCSTDWEVELPEGQDARVYADKDMLRTRQDCMEKLVRCPDCKGRRELVDYSGAGPCSRCNATGEVLEKRQHACSAQELTLTTVDVNKLIQAAEGVILDKDTRCKTLGKFCTQDNPQCPICKLAAVLLTETS